MGGHVGGEVASKTAIKTLSKLQHLLDTSEIDLDSKEDLYLNMVHEMDSEISSVSALNSDLNGMGTTITALAILEKNVSLLHVGDSRCYRIRSGKIEQISTDHTLVQELLTQGRITHDEIADHPQRSMLTQALMGNENIQPVLIEYPAVNGDIYLLCSDGLSGVLSDLEILNIVKKNSLEDAVGLLIDGAYQNGAPDNVTVILAQVSEDGAEFDAKFIGAANE
ncbi:MAG: serine/threonine protein phosphatase [Actinobacteria bacterium]|nr:serine/threonine protein phosphatase [Actinomycetota bacterium]MSX44365.1 serine/threonine protein phosphatase [Actinomycetota bacterium]MSX85664.1 serine/threonine protein phosphatase [Actinomycetota bacterium]MSY23961.1 serine/threonine protein phosphatase [Actinomycetota bacterium]MSY99992.1 serine/threonine protein phosphatase [Actinomycetota bacterium]